MVLGGGIGRRYEGHRKNSDTVQFRGAIGSLNICEVQILTPKPIFM